jgi:hypothetical protein
VSERDREGEWWASSANKDAKSSSKDTNREINKEKEKDKERDRDKDKDKDYFSIESIHDRLRVYAREGGVPLELVDRYSEHRKMKMTPFQEFQEEKTIEWKESRGDEDKEKGRWEKKRRVGVRRVELKRVEERRGEKKMESGKGWMGRGRGRSWEEEGGLFHSRKI